MLQGNILARPWTHQDPHKISRERKLTFRIDEHTSIHEMITFLRTSHLRTREKKKKFPSKKKKKKQVHPFIKKKRTTSYRSNEKSSQHFKKKKKKDQRGLRVYTERRTLYIHFNLSFIQAHVTSSTFWQRLTSRSIHTHCSPPLRGPFKRDDRCLARDRHAHDSSGVALDI